MVEYRNKSVVHCDRMTSLEQLSPGVSVRGLIAGTMAKVVQVEWFGDQAVKVTFEEPNGAVRNRLVYRSDEASLELVASGRVWSFGGDGYLFRLASEAQRIRLPPCSILTWRCRPR